MSAKRREEVLRRRRQYGSILNNEPSEPIVYYDLCKDFSSEPRWYAPKWTDKVDAMSLMFYGLLGKGKEGNKLSIDVEVDNYVDAGMTLREAVEEGQAKWEPIVEELNKLIRMIRVRCSFCSYFHECDRCPIGKDRAGDSERCVEYWELGRRLPKLRDLAQDVLDKINDTNVVVDCQHHKEAEITIAGDTSRYFQCVGCGRHRKE